MQRSTVMGLNDAKTVVRKKKEKPSNNIRRVPPGTIAEIDGYRLLSFLGEGGYSEVWSAYNAGTGQAAAIKFMTAFKQFGAKEAQKFLREWQVMKEVKHTYIAKLLGSDTPGDPMEGKSVFAYIMTEYVENGKTLLEFVLEQEQGYLVPEKAVELFLKICEAVHYLHKERKILHRDLKPANILIKDDGNPLIIDFGLAKMMDHASGHTLTGEQDLVGTSLYFPPEHLNGQAISEKGELYTLCVILYEMLSGRHIVNTESGGQVLGQIIMGNLIPLSTANPNVPKLLAKIVTKGLATNPANRYSSVVELMTALKQWQQKQTPQDSKILLKTPTWANILMTAMFLTLCCIVFFGHLFWGQHEALKQETQLLHWQQENLVGGEFSKALTFLKEKNYQKAGKAFSYCYSKNKSPLLSLWYMGICYQHLSDKENARKAFQKLQKIKPSPFTESKLKELDS